MVQRKAHDNPEQQLDRSLRWSGKSYEKKNSSSLYVDNLIDFKVLQIWRFNALFSVEDDDLSFSIKNKFILTINVFNFLFLTLFNTFV